MASNDQLAKRKACSQRKGGPLGVHERSRRQFVGALAAFGMTTAMPRGWLPAQAAAGAKPRLIDVHHHVFPPDLVKATLDGYIPQNRMAVSAWTPRKTLAEMDAHGVATAIVSMTSGIGRLLDAQAARTLVRNWNEYSARLTSDYPGRFGFFAALPLPDTEASLQEIAYALAVLKADGVGLMTSYGDKYLGDLDFAPVLEELNRRKAVVQVHPQGANRARNLVPGVPGAWHENPQETTRAILSLLVSGSLVRFGNIRFIFSHAGGTMPMVAGRISATSHFVDDFAEKAPRGFDYELKRFHYDIAGAADRSALAALMNLVPTSQIIFGSDYPFLPIAATAAGMTKVGLAAADLQAIRRDNATAMFHRRMT